MVDPLERMRRKAAFWLERTVYNTQPARHSSKVSHLYFQDNVTFTVNDDFFFVLIFSESVAV